MVDPALRIRLEGRVEELERALVKWSVAAKAAQRRDFAPAVELLQRGDELLTSHGDEALGKLLSRQLSLRREVEQLVARRLRLLGVPDIDLAAGAKWLQAEPILYEHHCLTTAFLLRAPFIAFWCAGLFGVAMRSWLLSAVAIALLCLAAHKLGRSDVVLTRRRLILEGQVIDLTHVKQVLVIRPFLTFLPMSFEVEVRGKSGHLLRDVRLRQASTGLRAALTALRLETGADWGPC